MIPIEDLENLDYNSLVDLLGVLTKQYTSELAQEPNRLIEDEKVYFLNLLIKEIEMREQMMFDKDDNLSLSF